MPSARDTSRAQQSEASDVIVTVINSRPFATFDDRLDDPEFQERLLRSMALEPDAVLTQAVCGDIRTIRDALARILLGSPADANREWDIISSCLRSATLCYDFSDGRPHLTQVGGEDALGCIATALADLLDSGDWSRVRVCANDHCSVAFFDTTRSKTQRWHSYETCGNRTNVAAYRARAARSARK